MALKSYRDYFAEADVAADMPPDLPTMGNTQSKVADVFGLGRERAGIMFNAKHLLARVMDRYPGDLRRLLRKMLDGGDFEDDQGFKLEMQKLYEELTSAKVRGTGKLVDRKMTNKKPQEEPKDFVSRPEADIPNGPLEGS